MASQDINKALVDKVTNAVCREVDTQLGTCTDGRQIRLYKGRKALNITMAKAISCLVLHDRYGLSYNSISHHFGHSMLNIIKCVSRTRHFLVNDSLYAEIYRMVSQRIEGEDNGIS